MQTAAKLMGAMNETEEEEDIELDIKSIEGTAKKENNLLAELHVAKELSYDARPIASRDDVPRALAMDYLLRADE